MSSSVIYVPDRPTWGGLPTVDVPVVPDTFWLWRRLLLVGTVLFALYLIDRLTFVLLDYWMLQELGYEAVFWTNVRAGALLFLWGF